MKRSGSVTLAGEGVRPRSGSALWGRRDEEGPHPPWFIDRVTPLAAALTNSPPYLRSLFLSLVFSFCSFPSPSLYFLSFSRSPFLFTFSPHPVSRNSINYLERNWVRISCPLIDRDEEGKEFGENIFRPGEKAAFQLGKMETVSRILCDAASVTPCSKPRGA